MSQYLLGIDLGTSSVKVALLDAQTLYTVADADAEYPINHPQPNYAEQSPIAWWHATVEATRKALQGIAQPDVIAIGLSGQMHGIVFLDSDKQPVRDAIIWADGRSAKQVQELLELQHRSDSVMPGFPATGFAASSALWLKQHAPDTLRKTDKWCLPKDYLRLKLTGDVATEPSDAASTWLFDIKKQAWAEDVYAYCGLTSSQMPKVVASNAVSGYLTEASAKELGLSANIPIVGGSADLPAQALGYGINDPNKLLITVGSGGQVFLPIIEPVDTTNRPYYVFNHNIENTWYLQTSILTAGLSLRWLRDFTGLNTQDDAYSHLSTLAEATQAGADGLLFLPYLAGERNPNPDGNAQGMIYGLKLNHNKGHFARAIMEGVAFAIKEALSHMPSDASTYVVAGGITNSPFWCQILADVLEHPLEVPTEKSPFGCVGVGILAGVGAGVYDSFDDALARLKTDENKQFIPQKSEVYKDAYARYLQHYQYMKGQK